MIEVSKIQEGVVLWTLSAPPCNEIGSSMLEALERELDALDVESTRVLVLHSASS